MKEENKTFSKNVTKKVLMIKTMALSTCARSTIQQSKFRFCGKFSHLVYSPDTPKKICQEMFHAVTPGTCWLVQNCTYPGRGVCSLLRAEGFYEKKVNGDADDLWSFLGYFITERSFVFVINKCYFLMKKMCFFVEFTIQLSTVLLTRYHVP